MNNGMLGGAVAPRLRFPEDERYCRVTWDAANGTEGGSIAATTWTTHAFNLVEYDPDGLVEKLEVGVLRLKPGRYFTRATACMMRGEQIACGIHDIQSGAVLAMHGGYNANNKIWTTLMQLEDVIDVRQSVRGIRFALRSSAGDGDPWVRGLSGAGGAADDGQRECHGVWEFWEERDS